MSSGLAGMSGRTVRVSPGWLALREPADAAARSVDLVDELRTRLSGRPDLAIHDLGSGTGSMPRWLAPRLAGRQHWVLYDRDPDLLAHAPESPDLLAHAPGSPDGGAGAGFPGGVAVASSDGVPATVETRLRDITRLPATDLAGADLITSSAVLDMFTADEVERVVAACVEAGCPALFTISVIGSVELSPPEPLDAEVADAFNAHQRRTADGRRLLGPDAVAATIDVFRGYGWTVRLRPSPWRLGPGAADLISEWFQGWLDAACEQLPELSGPAGAYRRRRLAQAAADRLRVVVHHRDLLATRR